MSRFISAQLGTMRKPQDFCVNPKQAGSDDIIVQSDKAIGRFDPATGKGVLSQKGCYFFHLTAGGGAKPYDFPADFVEQCVARVPKSGDCIGGGVYIA